MANAKASYQVQSTAGAVPVLNEKGEVSMQKVKVHRYVSGKRPEYAPASSSEEESEEEDFNFQRPKPPAGPPSPEPAEAEELREAEQEDPRLRRLLKRDEETEEVEEDRVARHRHIHAPEVLAEVEEPDDDDEEVGERIRRRHESEEEEEEEELSDEEIERRRVLLREKALNRNEEQELLDKEDEGDSAAESEEESSEYEEYTDSEEDAGPRLKPVFVRKKDRITVLAREKELVKQKQLEVEAKKSAEDRKRQTLKIVEEEIRKETIEREGQEGKWCEVETDDENDEVEYEAWKLRELKRVKRDKEEREQLEKERMEIERIRNMTEEERRQEFRNNPKLVTNKGTKGKYKFLQKYYHRGAFFMDREEDVYRRDFSAATLEDVFDKTILPKVMQVKNFGRSGRTKYTHLVDQDTTLFDSPWVTETAQNLKFHNNQSGGMKQTFERPSGKKRKVK